MLLLPLFLHVVWVFVLGMRMLRARVKAIRNGTAKMHEIAVDTGAWPKRTKLLGDNFSNQFETPVFWYALCGLVAATSTQDQFLTAMSWMYLLTRVGHSFVHTGYNDVAARMRIFVFGFFVLVVMWTWFTIKLFATL